MPRHLHQWLRARPDAVRSGGDLLTITGGDGWQKPDAGHRSSRPAEPAANGARALRQGGIERHRVARHHPPDRRGVDDHEHAPHAQGTPATLAGKEPGHHAALAVHRGVEVLDVGDAALDLDDEQRTRLSVPAHDVDAATIPRSG